MQYKEIKTSMKKLKVKMVEKELFSPGSLHFSDTEDVVKAVTLSHLPTSGSVREKSLHGEELKNRLKSSLSQSYSKNTRAATC